MISMFCQSQILLAAGAAEITEPSSMSIIERDCCSPPASLQEPNLSGKELISRFSMGTTSMLTKSEFEREDCSRIATPASHPHPHGPQWMATFRQSIPLGVAETKSFPPI